MSVEVTVERLDSRENQALQSDGYQGPYECTMQDPYQGTQSSEYAKLMDKLPSNYISNHTSPA
jgi:hypothetical protein